MNQQVAIQVKENEFLFGTGVKDSFDLLKLEDLHLVDSFIDKHKGEHIFFLLSYELGCELLNTILTKPRTKSPLAKFWVAENTSKTELSAADEVSLDLGWKFGSTKENYISSVTKIQAHIQQGDCYELNFCQRISAKGEAPGSGLAFFNTLRKLTNAPHSAYFEDDHMILASGSPERFIKKEGNRLISQPIKGTAPRGKNADDDSKIMSALLQSEKDFVENVMIVDLVRNDCSKIAAKGSVKVDELSKLYTFETVHQLISTISCDIKAGIRFSEILEALYPMGSMTGAPKKSAVQLSENYESHARQWYSGSIGYIDKNGDFDSNVLIRTIFYDKTEHEYSCMVGGAITHMSNPEDEWEECKTKVGKIVGRFGTCQW